jgi:glycine cleavage system H protein
MEEYTHQADKFVFHIRKNLLYSKDEVWVKVEGDHVRIGLTDFAQRNGGDIIFAEVLPIGTQMKRGEPIGSYETIKLVQDVLSPVGGIIDQINPLLESKPEVINSDPYGEGWLVTIKPKPSFEDLLSAENYFELMKLKIVDELKKIKED